MSSRTLVRFGVLAVVGAAVAAYVWQLNRPTVPPAPSDPGEPSQEAPDPRLTFNTPFRNVRPDVAFVGDAGCAPCHKGLCESYHQHPMGRSAALWPAAGHVEQFGPAAHATFDGSANTRYRVTDAGDRLLQIEERLGPDGRPIVETVAEAAIVIGSGHQARSYLCVRDGSLWQTGLSWYTTKQRWDLSPGFGPGMHAQRPVTELCLFCHVDRVERVPATENRYREPLFARQAQIGCERCHGPGGLHVEERMAGAMPAGPDTSIVNPRHLAPDLRDAVCQQCHLQGEYHVIRRGRSPFDYRPGLPLEQFITVYMKAAPPGEAPRFVGHVEQTAASRCAAGSAGRLGCTSCHDPHADPLPAAREAHFRQACLNCHADRGCTLPAAERLAKHDACTGCHMPPAAASVTHTAVTDHRIPRRPGGAVAATPAGPPLGLPVRPYHDGSPYQPSADERERDLGIALAYLVRRDAVRGVSDRAARDAAAEHLGRTVRRFPSDAAAWESYAYLLGADGNGVEALAAAERALAAEPGREPALHQAIMTALQLHDPARARGYARQAVAENPGNPLSRIVLGLALTELREWGEAEEALRVGLRDMPGHPGGRAALAVCLFRRGDRAGGRAELNRLAALTPDQARMWQEWVRQRVGP